MKNKLLLLMVVASLFFQQNLTAQLPKVSTADNPIWYYIQVVGTDADRYNRVFVAKTDGIYGEALNKSSDAQLFRFEQGGSNYYIVSKSTGQKIATGLAGSDPVLTLTENGILFKIETLATHYYTIVATNTPSSGNNWAHQGNSGYSWRVILTNTSWNTGGNSQYSFVPYESLNLEYSTAGQEVWYSINSAKSGLEGKCITDVSSNGEAIKLSVNANASADNQMWKIVANSSKVDFINKSTGNILQTKSDLLETNLMYNYTQLTNNLSESDGWTLNYLRAGQYAISGVEEDLITRYLNASVEGSLDEYNADNLSYSGFAWKFLKTEKNVSIPVVSDDSSNVFVYVENKKIIVKGADDYTVRTIYGAIIPAKDRELPIGVYLVTVKGKTTKLVVK